MTTVIYTAIFGKRDWLHPPRFIERDCKYVCFTDQESGAADFTYRNISHPRCFEWNLFHGDQMAMACLDMDGVLCADWTGRECDSGFGLDRYRNHLTTAAPLHIPTYPVLAVVTSRLEKYRAETNDWLQRHGIRFHELIMSPHPTAAARQQANDHAARKAAAYDRITKARLFVESDVGQAREIARRTNRPVICSTSMTLF